MNNKKINQLRDSFSSLQSIADNYGINDVFQDNNAKLLEILLILDLQMIHNRCGNDAIDDNGDEYEIKTVNTNLTSGVTTHHHLDLHIIEKYRKAKWIFGFYKGTSLTELYVVSPENLEQYFSKWEEKILLTGKTINNPKIAIGWVRKFGIKRDIN